MNFKVELIDGWQKAYKFLSVKLGLIGAAIFAFISIFPDSVLMAWNSIPADLKAALPPKFIPIIGSVFMIVAVFARLIKQPKATIAVQEAAVEKEMKDTIKENTSA